MTRALHLTIMPAAFAALVTGAVFRLWPALDLWIAGWFYSDTEGFFLANSWFAQAFYAASPLIMWGLVFGLVALLIATIVDLLPIGARPWRLATVLLIAVVLGPGLLVNTVFKDNWGRARPAQATQFNGPLKFSPPLVKSDQCLRNCSFPAGHPSMIFLGFAIAGAFAGRRRRRIIVGVAVAGGLSGLGRMMQGGHFLSDVLFSGFITYGAAWLAWSIVDGQARAGPLIGRLFGAVLAALVSFAGGATSVFLSKPARRWLLPAAAIAIGIGGLDRVFAQWAGGPTDTSWATAMTWVSHLSRPLYLVTALVVIVAGLQLHAQSRLAGHARPTDAARMIIHRLAIAGGVAYGLAAVLKVLIGRSRPSEWFADATLEWGPFGISHSWWSFPSAHTAMAVALALTAAKSAPRYRYLFYGAGVLVAFSRIWLAAHWFSDVVAGAIVGVAAATLTCQILPYRRTSETNP